MVSKHFETSKGIKEVSLICPFFTSVTFIGESKILRTWIKNLFS